MDPNADRPPPLYAAFSTPPSKDQYWWRNVYNIRSIQTSFLVEVRSTSYIYIYIECLHIVQPFLIKSAIILYSDKYLYRYLIPKEIDLNELELYFILFFTFMIIEQ